MSSWLDGFAILSLAYIVIGLGYLFRFVRDWRSLWDDDLTPADAKLAAGSAFFLLIPPTVALHELGHAVAIWAYGLKVLGWMFYGYMGAVAHHPTAAGALGNFTIALAGNAVTFVIGASALAFGLKRPGHPVRNILAIELGRQSLFLVLVFYPALCLAFPGDFQTIYDFSRTPIASAITAVVHGLIVVVGWSWWKRMGQARVRLLCSPMARDFLDAERRDDSLRLGQLYAAAGDFGRARALLAPITATMTPHQRLLYGRVCLESGDPEVALVALELASRGLIRTDDRAEAERLMQIARSQLPDSLKQ